jgi:hypothetical protein
VSDHKAGVLLLLIALLLRVAFNQSSLTRVVITEAGGSKRLRALSVCFSTLILAPWAFFNLFSSVRSIYFNINVYIFLVFYVFYRFCQGFGPVKLRSFFINIRRQHGNSSATLVDLLLRAHTSHGIVLVRH